MTALAGLLIKLHPCRTCGCDIAHIIEGLDAQFCCEQCDRVRGHLTDHTQDFLCQAIKLWGRPSAPLLIRRSNFTETSSQPSGAGAQM